MNILTSLQRMRGVFRRHTYLWFRNPEYFFDTFWQPIVEVLIWGFISFYLGKVQSNLKNLGVLFLGAIVLWAVLRRAQHEITFSLMEEAWSRNMQNILVTPLTMAEYYTASIAFGMIKLVFEIGLMGILIALIFKFNITVIGFALIPFSINLLLTGWAIGLFVNAAIIYFGRGLVALSWIIAFVLQPFACVFYPLSALPPWAKIIAELFPATWVFEGMREVLNGQSVTLSYMSNALILNAVYLAIGSWVFSKVMRIALDRGLLMKLEW